MGKIGRMRVGGLWKGTTYTQGLLKIHMKPTTSDDCLFRTVFAVAHKF